MFNAEHAEIAELTRGFSPRSPRSSAPPAPTARFRRARRGWETAAAPLAARRSESSRTTWPRADARPTRDETRSRSRRPRPESEHCSAWPQVRSRHLDEERHDEKADREGARHDRQPLHRTENRVLRVIGEAEDEVAD